jgi:CRP/FNR family transcriptional regulator
MTGIPFAGYNLSMIRKNRTLPFKVETTRCDSCFMELRCWPESQPRSTAVPVEREPTLLSGASLWRHGAPFESLYVVRSGAVKVHETDVSGEERVLQFAFAGDLIGLESLASGHHDNNATALSETMVCRLDWPPREEAIPDAQLRERLLRRASTLLRGRQRATRMADPDASVRLFLHEIAGRIGREEHEGEGRHVRVRLPMSRLEIGQYLGYAEETVCRSMRRLQRAGELQVSGRTLLLHATGTASSVPGAAPVFTVVAPPRSAQGASSAAPPAR